MLRGKVLSSMGEYFVAIGFKYHYHYRFAIGGEA